MTEGSSDSDTPDSHTPSETETTSNPSSPIASGTSPDSSSSSDGKRPKDNWDKAQIALSALTAILVGVLNWQAGRLKASFDESKANTQMVQSFVDDLAEPRKSDFALIALYYHAHDINRHDTIEMVVDLAKATVRAAAGDKSINQPNPINTFAMQTIIRQDDAAEYQALRNEITPDLTRPQASSGKSPAGAAGGAIVASGAKAQQAAQTQQLAQRALLGAKATVYIQYTTSGVTDRAALAKLQDAAQNLAQTLRQDANYVVPPIESVNVNLSRTSVRYYYLTDKDAARALATKVGSALQRPNIGVLYNGPAQVPAGQLELWVAEKT